MDLAAAREIKLLDQSDSSRRCASSIPGYTLVTIPKGTYPKQDKDVKVIGFVTHVVASCKLPADTVYTMTKTIAENTKTLATVAKDIGALTPKEMAEDIGVPFHPGAAKFYKEAGVTVKTRLSRRSAGAAAPFAAGAERRVAGEPATHEDRMEPRGLFRLAVIVISIAMALYHMWAIAFGSPEAIPFRGTHLLFALVLVFLLYRFRSKTEDRIAGGGVPGIRRQRAEDRRRRCSTMCCWCSASRRSSTCSSTTNTSSTASSTSTI